MVLGCIGIGSNAIRMLEAGWNEGRLAVIKREREGTRLFAGLEAGYLREDSMQRSLEAVAQMKRIADEDQVDGIYMFATSAVRDAKNGSVFSNRCEEIVGVPVEIISGEQEAVYSYLGAMVGGKSGVIDIGGGSTEFTLGNDAAIDHALSLQMGAVRMNEQRPILNLNDYESTVAICERMIRESFAGIQYEKDLDWTGVGGTLTTLGAMEQKIELFDPETSEGMMMSYEQVHRYGSWLAMMPMEERRHITGLMPHRADIIPSGIAILDAAMDFFDIESIRLSARGNMDGYLKKKFWETVDR